MKKLAIVAALLFALLSIGGCSDADVASKNLSTAADQFEVERRVVFFNGITDTYLLVIEGRCSINYDVEDKQLEVTVKVGHDEFKKHYLGLSDNVTYFVEQTKVVKASVYHYRVIFKPSVIVPNIDLEVGQ